jgi:hypothetical protein
MERTNTVRIRAPQSRIFYLASRVEQWPEWLPHYRWVKVRRQLTAGRRIVEMAASRDGIPVRWVAIQDLDPDAGAITFRHIGGPTTGMQVAWILRPTTQGGLVAGQVEDNSRGSTPNVRTILEGNGVVEARIEHRFTPAWPPLVGPLLARHVVGNFFISNIADKTLARVKQLAESPTAPGGEPWP